MKKTITDILNIDNENVELTVALPVFNSKDILWIAMEGLCNQKDIDFKWELLICEEKHSNAIGIDFFNQYIDRLKDVGCCRITYIHLSEWVNLPTKWKILGEHTHKKSKTFLLQAADCYSYSLRLHNTYKKIVKENYDWYDVTKGYFYSFISDRLVLYNIKSLTNLNMGFKTSYARKIPNSDLKRGIDGFLFNMFGKIKKKKLKVFQDNTLYNTGIDTHGFNNISIKRELFFDQKPNIFKKTNKKLNDLDIDADIIKKIKAQYENSRNKKRKS